MSVVMYAYRIPKDQWWEFVKSCRGYYLDNYPVVEILTKAASKKDVKYSDFQEILQQFLDWNVDIQLFPQVNTYIFRVIEHDYFFMNNFDSLAMDYSLERVYYDTRSEVPSEEEKNREISDWVDEKILSREYFLYPLLTQSDMKEIFYNVL